MKADIGPLGKSWGPEAGVEKWGSINTGTKQNALTETYQDLSIFKIERKLPRKISQESLKSVQ